jgi:hypothetical protein
VIRQRLRSLLTMDGTPRGIAGGFALGLSLSLVPIPFAGMLLALAVDPQDRWPSMDALLDVLRAALPRS